MINTGLTQAEVTNLIQSRLIAARNALRDIAELYKWTSGITATDLSTASTYSSTDATTVLSAIADMNAVETIVNTGAPGAAYPQLTVPSGQTAYIFGQSMRQVIGPQ